MKRARDEPPKDRDDVVQAFAEATDRHAIDVVALLYAARVGASSADVAHYMDSTRGVKKTPRAWYNRLVRSLQRPHVFINPNLRQDDFS